MKIVYRYLILLSCVVFAACTASSDGGGGDSGNGSIDPGSVSSGPTDNSNEGQSPDGEPVGIDSEGPTGAVISEISEFMSFTQIKVSYDGATDNVTTPPYIEYKLVYSLSDNIQSKADAIANGTIARDYQPGGGEFTQSGLTRGTPVYFGLFTRDAEGNETFLSTSVSSVEFCGGGPGSAEGNAFEICSLSQLNMVREGLDLHYKLMNDIDASVTENWDDDDGWEPIGDDLAGDDSDNFTGGFDGDFYKIKGLSIDRPTEDRVGLFGYAHNADYIKNLGVIDANIEGREFSGVICGSCDSIPLSYLYSSGFLSGQQQVGGLVGFKGNEDFLHSFSTVEVTASNVNVGGAVGNFGSWDTPEFNYSYSTGDVFAGNAGGFIGLMGDRVNFSYATGNIVATNHTAAGFAGGTSQSVNGSATHTFATGNAYTPNNWAAGYSGWIRENASVTYSFATGHSSAVSSAGFQVNDTTTTIVQYSLATGYLANAVGQHGVFSAEDRATGMVENYGLDRGQGFTCDETTTDANCNLVKTGSAKPFEFRLAPELEYVQMKFEETPSLAMRKISLADQENYFLWGSCTVQGAVINISATDASTTVTTTATCAAFAWKKEINLSTLQDGAVTITLDQAGSSTRTLNLTKETDYCAANSGTNFANDNQSGIDGSTPAKAYTICTAAQFDNLRLHLAAGNHFILKNNLDLSWDFSGPIGDDSNGDCTSRWCGKLDGNGFVLRRAYIVDDGLDYAGIFGSTDDASSEIKNLGLEDIHVKVNSIAGTLVGQARFTTIEDVYVQGHVGSSSQTGGLVGNAESVTISGSLAHTHIISGSQSGGFIGRMSAGSVTQSRAIGHVIAYDTGDNYAGGFVGQVTGTAASITQSVAEGHVSSAGQLNGGFIGDTDSIAGLTITDNFASGSVLSSGSGNGAFIGSLSSASSTSNLLRCYASGHVIASDTNTSGTFVGEIAAAALSTSRVENAVAMGAISGAVAASSGGFVGNVSSADGEVVDSTYWNNGVSINACNGSSSDTTNVTCNAANGGSFAALNYSLESTFTNQTPLAIYTNWNFSTVWKWEGVGKLPLLLWQYQP